MMENFLRYAATVSGELLDVHIKGKSLPRINLSVENPANVGSHLFEFAALEAYVRRCMEETGSNLLWGGYLERRALYRASPLFQEEKNPRDIHLGLDFWTAAGSTVYAPLAGTIHSFQDNNAFKDYGPTVILRHELQGKVFHTLYGHLSTASLEALEIGQTIQKGQRIGWLGNSTENGNWPPHLHFQIIMDMQDYAGDYPGVCAFTEVEQYASNCPDPSLLLGL